MPDPTFYVAAADAAAPFAPAVFITAILALGYFVLVAVAAFVAMFATGTRSKNAFQVLKVLTRRKVNPPGPHS